MPLHLIALIALACPQESSASLSLTPVEYYRAHRQAAELYESQAWSEAAPLYEKLVQHFPADGQAWFNLGVAQYYLGNYSQAVQAFEQTIDLGHRRIRTVHYSLALCRTRLGDPDAAFSSIEGALTSRYENRADLQSDSNLNSLRDDARWDEISGTLPEREWTRVEGWRYDLDFLVKEAQRLNAGPQRPAFSLRFLDSAAKLRAAVPELTDDQMLAETLRLVAILDDGHSAIYQPRPESPLKFEPRALPFKFYWFPDGLYIVDGAGDWAEHAGSRVVRFGDLPAEEVLRRMAEYRGVDNPMTWKWMGPQFYVRQALLLREVGATSSADSVELALETLEGEKHSLSVETGEFELVRKLRPSPAALETPLFLSAVDKNYWMEPLPEYGALYLQFNQVQDAAGESIAKLSLRMRKTLAEEKLQHLIIDLRHNNGGNNNLVRPLVRALVEFDMASADHRIFVITGRNTFSAAQNFINHLERWTDAEFAGEPSSSCPNFVGEETEVILPYSRLQGSISSRYWQDSDPGDERPWIAPDLPVELTALDYFDGVDPVLEAVLEVLAEG